MTTGGVVAAAMHGGAQLKEKRRISIFDLPEKFFDSCRLLPPGKHSFSAVQNFPVTTSNETLGSFSIERSDELEDKFDDSVIISNSMNRWSCNTCKIEFDSLLDQRYHFRSDVHRFNVKLSLAGKDILKEDDLEQLTSDSFSKDFDVSSISGSEDEDDRPARAPSSANEALVQREKLKIFVRLQSGEKVSIWKSLILKDSEIVSCENDQLVAVDDKGCVSLRENDVISKLKVLTHGRRDNNSLRIVLLASGGHFAACVFDRDIVVASKTFHRYVVRAKAGKKQSSKDGGGKSIHSAGASLRRYNELALKKNIQELLTSWKTYFDASSCVFISASSNNRQMLYHAESPLSSNQRDVRNIPFTVRRPTLKETRRIYGQLSQVVFEVDEVELPDIQQLDLNGSCESDLNSVMESMSKEARIGNAGEACEPFEVSDDQPSLGEIDTEVILTLTPLHEAAKSSDVEKVLELLEQGMDPTVKDDRGRTPYMVATEKEVRNTFRRFMASNLEKWDWHAANVPSALTKEMEESQAAKQAAKDAKRKAKAKELKKLRKEKEKKAQAKAAEAQKVASVSQSKGVASSSNTRSVQSVPVVRLSKEEELKRKLAEERDKRAAAAERRIAMAASATAIAQAAKSSVTPSTSQPRSGVVSDIICSCCSASLEGKVPFHRYNYKYCSTTCMKVHKEFLEDG